MAEFPAGMKVWLEERPGRNPADYFSASRQPGPGAGLIERIETHIATLPARAAPGVKAVGDVVEAVGTLFKDTPEKAARREQMEAGLVRVLGPTIGGQVARIGLAGKKPTPAPEERMSVGIDPLSGEKTSYGAPEPQPEQPGQPGQPGYGVAMRQSGPVSPGGLSRISGEMAGTARDIEDMRAQGLKDMATAEGAVGAAMDLAAKTGASKAAETAAYKRQADAEMRQQVFDQQRNEEERQVKTQRATQRLEDLQRQFMSTKVDPERWWNSRTEGQKAMAAIGLALGTFGAAMTKTPNVALAMFNKSIDNDIAAQKMELDKRGQTVGMQRNLMGMMRQQFGDEKAAESAARIALTNTAVRQLDLLATRYKGTEMQQNAQMMKAQLQQRNLGEQQKFEQSIHGLVQKNQNARANVAAQRSSLAMQRRKMAAASSAAGQQNVLPRGVVATGTGSILPKQAAVARERVAAYHAAIAKFDSLIAWRDEYGAEFIPSEHYEQAKTDQNNLINILRVVTNSGSNLTEKEVEYFGLGDEPGEIGFVLAKLKRGRQNMQQDFESYLHTNHMRWEGGAKTTPAYGNR